jgi:hypothetical protein
MPHTTCATVAADVHVLALVVVMNSVVVPWLVVALLARRLEASMSTSTQRGNAEGPLRTSNAGSGVRTRRSTRPPPLTMHAAVCSALGRRLSRSDSALLGNAHSDATRTAHEVSTVHGVRTSPTMRPLMPLRTSPVFARMLANTREAPPTPRRGESM